MKFILIATVVGLPLAMASPTESPSGRNLFSRDNPKLNQYRTLDDCKNDRNILFHAAPTMGNCYDLDGQTGAFFYNTAGYQFARATKDIGCAGESIRLRGAECMEKGDFKTVNFR